MAILSLFLVTLVLYAFLGFKYTVLLLGLLMFLGWFAYFEDKAREHRSAEGFRGMQLFSRYGHTVIEESLPIPLKETLGEASEVTQRFSSYIAQTLESSLVQLGIQVAPMIAWDQDKPSDRRRFIRVFTHTSRGSQLYHFFYLGVAGKYIVAHLRTQARGSYTTMDVVYFIVTAPGTIWFWGIPWLKNQYSIIAALSSWNINAFDLIDLTTAFQASYQAIWRTVLSFLEAENLLTDDLQQIINYNIITGTQVNIQNSKDVRIGNILNRIQRSSRG